MPYRSDFMERLYEEVKWAGEYWKTKAKILAPNHLKNAIVYKTWRGEGKVGFEGGAKITFGDDRKFADARAREFGSGKWAKTKKKKYPILPRKKKYLAFEWEKANKNNLDINLANRMRDAWASNLDENGFFDPTGFQADLMSSGKYMGRHGDLLMFNKVMHPGFQAANKGKGYLGLAMKICRKEWRENKVFQKAITPAIRRELQVILTPKKAQNFRSAGTL